ncbi:protein of unassigned function [Methylobacterium oryzae CBMB20]|uniref:Protein of unassigned function n=1 Tax=Methylobacterium oryzae CBMB20 TaxID=693986 RepID=A0A089P6Y1_9HYPH|nr:protein of unassigned function [Methylobacterium oryzae CBMB20]
MAGQAEAQHVMRAQKKSAASDEAAPQNVMSTSQLNVSISADS